MKPKLFQLVQTTATTLELYVDTQTTSCRQAKKFCYVHTRTLTNKIVMLSLRQLHPDKERKWMLTRGQLYLDVYSETYV